MVVFPQKKDSGQGSLEYILLIGGAVLVSIIVLILVIDSTGSIDQSIVSGIGTYDDSIRIPGSLSGGGGNPPVCGNGTLETGEECDDGNTIDNDTCANDCTLNPVPTCNNGIIDAGETCDPPQAVCVPAYGSTCTYCNAVCQSTEVVGGYCGDSIVNGSEACDDGNTVDNDTCTNTCEISTPVLNYQFNAKFEPPVGLILHGMGQWNSPTSGNPKYVNLLTNTSENPLASPNYYPASQLMFVPIADDARWPNFIANFPSNLAQQQGLGMIPHLSIELRGLQPITIDPMDPLYGIDDEIAHTTTWDARIGELADAYAANGKPAFVRIGGEFNGPWNGYHPYDYPIAYRKIVQIFADHGADNVAFIWCYEPAAPSDFLEQNGLGEYKWFPGNDVIDWYGLDVFGPEDFVSGGLHYNKSISFLNAAASAGKPVLLAETSVSMLDITPDPSDGMSDWSAWFVPFFSFIENNPQIEGFHYINYNWGLSPYYFANGWKNADITVNAYVSNQYLLKITDEQFLHAPDTSLLNHYTDYP